MNAKAHSCGFTMVELLAAAVASAVLALALGSILYFSYAALRRNNEQLATQRDLAYAMDVIQREVRLCSPSDVQVDATGFTLATNFLYSVRRRVYDSRTGDLVYDPNVSIGGDEQILINDRLVGFSSVLSGSRLIVVLSVQASPGLVITWSNSVALRN